MLDRRAFLRRLGFGTVAAAAAANGVLDVERLLWAPGERTIILPAAPTIAPLSQTLLRGDIFTIAGRYTVNPITRQATPFLQQFVVTHDVHSGDVLTIAHVSPRVVLTENLIDGRHVKPLNAGAHVTKVSASR